ncbi:MAG TPA: hypothetical protein HPP87_07110 [Planctomycetes bacterium]|nr:hypothetical protein [Planctomycetota bacterium]
MAQIVKVNSPAGNHELFLLDIVGLSNEAYAFYKNNQSLLSPDFDFDKKMKSKIVKVVL